jgi:hypothetical protein
MNWTFINHKNINSIGHDPEKNVMLIEFQSGKTYAYDGITSQKHNEIMNSESAGHSAMEAIKGKNYTIVS